MQRAKSTLRRRLNKHLLPTEGLPSDASMSNLAAATHKRTDAQRALNSPCSLPHDLTVTRNMRAIVVEEGTPHGNRSGLADSASESGDEQGGEGPAEDLGDETGDGDDLASPGGPGQAGGAHSGRDQGQSGVDAKHDPVDAGTRLVGVVLDIESAGADGKGHQ